MLEVGAQGRKEFPLSVGRHRQGLPHSLPCFPELVEYAEGVIHSHIRTMKEQLSRLAGADFHLGIGRNGRAITVKGTVIKGLE